MKLAALSMGAMLAILPMNMSGSQMQHSTTNRSFQPLAKPLPWRIEQPLAVKIGVVLGGMTLIGAELWWFLGRTYAQRQVKQFDRVE